MVILSLVRTLVAGGWRHLVLVVASPSTPKPPAREKGESGPTLGLRVDKARLQALFACSVVLA